MEDRVLIFDTTMRDGEQAMPNPRMPPETKVKIARWLERLNVDVIEAGFAISSPNDFDGIRKISEAVSKPIICALARVKQIDVEAAAKSLEHAKKARIHVFASTSDIHIKYKFNGTRDMILEWTFDEVSRAKKYFDDIEFSAEDATRTDIDYLIKVIRTAVEAGATTINIPDTVGYIQTEEYGEIIDKVSYKTPDHVTVSVHCHDDLGQAVANSLIGVTRGARQVEGCFLGIGERAGNAALEEVIMALHTREDYYQAKTGINISELVLFSKFLSKIIDYPISGHKAIIGSNAFKHSSGIHVDGIIKGRETYEIMKPESIGWGGEEKEIAMVSHLGRSGIEQNLERIGYTEPELANEIYDEFIELANDKGRLTDEDLHMLVQEYSAREEAIKQNLFVFEKNGISFTSDENGNKATVCIRRGGNMNIAHETGDGPVNAIIKAIKEALLLHGEDIKDHAVRFFFTHGKGGSEAVGFVTATVKLDQNIGYGRASSVNLVHAYAKAYLDAINHMIHVPVSEEKEMLRKVFE